ncbi:MAG TPA: chalcone isomerase family protein [Thermoanaerobaculia bacterium]|nr:chalcone isomerase family protein [Thermoanaerobaculia bacterium]
MRKLLIGILVSVTALAAEAANVGGVNISDTSIVGGQDLVLNGAGLRKKLFIKVYTGALYLPAKQASPERILAADTPRQMVMHFVYDVDKGKIAEAWEEGLEANTPNTSPAVKQAFSTLGSWMEDMKKGERITLTYVPGAGTTIDVRGTVKGVLPEKAVADAILATWIGPKPGPGEAFKKALLGGK